MKLVAIALALMQPALLAGCVSVYRPALYESRISALEQQAAEERIRQAVILDLAARRVLR